LFFIATTRKKQLNLMRLKPARAAFHAQNSANCNKLIVVIKLISLDLTKLIYLFFIILKIR